MSAAVNADMTKWQRVENAPPRDCLADVLAPASAAT
jgi:hypothetical protein